MMVLPAIDLREHAVVQLVGGDYEAERLRLPDPLAVAARFRAEGFRELHVVDLDAATGRGDNSAEVAALVQTGAVVQAGGGVRSSERVDALLGLGAARVVVGTRAVEDPAWLEGLVARHPGKLVVAADVRGREVVVRGWKAGSGLTLDLVLERLKGLPLAGVLVTAVHVEGKLEGVDAPLFREALASTDQRLIASGGITTLGDLAALAALGVAGSVVGTALYTGAIAGADAAKEHAAWP